jgi:hypothetical protein
MPAVPAAAAVGGADNGGTDSSQPDGRPTVAGRRPAVVGWQLANTFRHPAVVDRRWETKAGDGSGGADGGGNSNGSGGSTHRLCTRRSAPSLCVESECRVCMETPGTESASRVSTQTLQTQLLSKNSVQSLCREALHRVFPQRLCRSLCPETVFPDSFER